MRSGALRAAQTCGHEDSFLASGLSCARVCAGDVGSSGDSSTSRRLDGPGGRAEAGCQEVASNQETGSLNGVDKWHAACKVTLRLDQDKYEQCHD